MKIQSWDGCLIRSILISAALALALTGCGGGGGGTDTGTATGTTSYTVGGSVSGLVGSVVLRENISSNNLTVTANGTYTFTVQVASGSPYYITVLTQPAGQTCTISGGTGIISGNVNNVDVACTNTHTVGGTVSGLSDPSNPVVLQDNKGDDLSISANGNFTFATPVASGSAYKVTVLTQPSGETCSVSSGAGTVSGGNVTTVVVVCSATAYTVGGTVSGLNGSAVLQVNDGNDLTVRNGNFTFATPAADVANGSPYYVTLLSLQFPNQTCTITGNGTIAGANVSSVVVDCAKNTTPRFAYVANRDSNDVSAYKIDSTSGVLTPISCSGTSCSGSNFLAGNNPYSVTVDPSGKFAYVANNGSDDVSAYTITSTGALAPNGTAVAGIKPSSVSVDPTGKFAYVANWGDGVAPGTVSAYTITSTGALAPNGAAVAAGTTPYSVTVDPSGKFAYVANRDSGDVSAYTIDSTTGALTEMVNSPFGAGTGPGSVTVDPSGKFAYVANWNSGDVSAYTIDSTTGALTQIPCGGGTGCIGDNFLAGSIPNSVTVAVDSLGNEFAYVANWGSDNVLAYTIDSTTGALTAVGSSQVAAGRGPFSVTVDPSGKFAYVANQTTGDVSAYTIDSSGALTQIPCGIGTGCNVDNFLAGTSPVSVTTTP